MTEAEWLRCRDPQRMLEVLRGRASHRKLRLFACACCRHILYLFGDGTDRAVRDLGERFARALGAAERLADDPAPSAGLREARQLVWNVRSPSRALRDAAWAVRWAVKEMREGEPPTVDAAEPVAVALEAAQRAAWAARGAAAVAEADVRQEEERRYQCHLLRDIFGNPFRPASGPACWLTRNDRTVGKVAGAIYDEGRWGDVPVLADALEEAGCTNEDVLSHCREAGPHVRGCWPVDLLLGKD
jgi:hypothetical protein